MMKGKLECMFLLLSNALNYRKIGLSTVTSLFYLEKGILSNKKFLQVMTEDLEDAKNANKFYAMKIEYA